MYNFNNNSVKPWSPASKRRVYSTPNKATFKETKNFMDAMKDTIDKVYNNFSVTENGAIGYKTTGHTLLDMNFAVSSYRNASSDKIISMFRKAFNETPELAMRWLFYVRDVRGGTGERRLFREIIKDMANHFPGFTKMLIPYVQEYGRIDDLWILLETPCKHTVLQWFANQIREDVKNMKNNKPVSLCAKWACSENASSSLTRRYANMMMDALRMSPREYRKTLSELRRYIDVVERKMSNQDWEEIDYETVPSKANLLYNNAFLRHDENRRRLFLNAVKKGEAKINAGTLFPHEIVHKYKTWGIDETLEALWKNLPDTVQGAGNVMVVADGSGSMTQRVGNTSIQALEVANALAIYFAERSSGQFKDKYITFSMTPQYVDISQRTLRQKLNEALRHNECANTNIEAVFDMILKTAVDNNLSQEDIPGTILIISDMEYNGSVSANPVNSSRHYWDYTAPTATLFDTIRAKYEAHGYQLPKLAFWNVCSRTNTIPVKENDLGVALVSGFSVNTIKMVLSNKLDPWEILKETLMDHRYDFVTNVMTEYQNKLR